MNVSALCLVPRPLPTWLSHCHNHDPSWGKWPRALAGLLNRAWLRLYHRLEISGRENLPAGGSFVLVANHSSHLDTLCLLAALPLQVLHRTHPVAAEDYFFTSPAGLAAAWAVNALPFQRHGSVRASLEACNRLLRSDENILIIYPEGTRALDGTIGPFKRGIGELLASRRTLAVPCHIDGSWLAWPKGAWLPRPRQVRLHIGRPRNYAHLAPCKRSASFIAADLRRAVVELAPCPVPSFHPLALDCVALNQGVER